MTCRELIQFIDSYIDGSLTREEQANFAKHLAVCKACVDYLESYRTTLALEKAAYKESSTPAKNIPEDLVRTILASRV